MIVTCPNCETKFEIPDEKYKPGRKARCSNCQFIFALPERNGAAETPAPEIPPVFPAAGPAAMSPAGEETADTAACEDAPPPPPASIEEVVLPPDPAPAPGKKGGGKKRKILIGLGVALILLLLGYGGMMVYTALFSPPESTVAERGADGRLTRSPDGGTGAADPEKEAARRAAVSRLALENVRQYRVLDNDKTGPLVVIEGSVVNNFDAPKDLILLEITIYDAKGKPIIMREQYCGVTLSLLQLRTLSKSALEAALGNEVTILTNNTNVQPGMRVPFTTVFFDLPGSAYEFEVRIVDVQEPASK